MSTEVPLPASDVEMAELSGSRIRAMCRAGTFARPTAGVARGYTQANLVVLPSELAQHFLAFCDANPKPCPLLEATEPGRCEPAETAPGADLRTDLPRYRVYRRGKCVDRPKSITPYWPDTTHSAPGDLVAFLIGCSFTFEDALIVAGVPVRHVEQGRNVPMYRTGIECKPAGPFSGPLVVSMRPMTPEQAQTASRVTAAYPRVHGDPIHVGNPRDIGINDISRPDYGDSVDIHPGETPVFWACGVTPIEAIRRARPELAITHEPGHMFVTDWLNESLREQPRM